MSVIICGEYEHYKGNRYKVISIAKHSETLEKLVVYQALYGNREVWVRPYNMFCEKIQKDNTEIPRFKYVGDEKDLTCEIQLELSDDLKREFFENGIDVEKEILQNIDVAGIEHKIVGDSNHRKDLAVVIIASGVSISLILQSIAKLCRAINEKPITTEQTEFDEKGRIIRKSQVLLEPQKASQKTEIDFEMGSRLIKLKVLDQSDN